MDEMTIFETLHNNSAADAAQLLRNVLGCYPTGVTVITTRTADNRPVGLTINSFASLSLDPPLLLWSLANKSSHYSIFCATQDFAINVLAAHQGDIAMKFANSNIANKFDGVKLHDVSLSSGHQMPLLDGALAHFVCRTHNTLVAGDHTLFIGQIVKYHHKTGEPLVFHQKQFTRLAN